ncbi:MAG: anaerobic ribonucleoside-triphosphate reductase activating protein [Candidatus Thermoplasmatota archaeon]|nr:anaerobic ribonucleoside-triphosphate reductase activating protein [Candidatus Thermoplasmatota archaeon]
MPISNVKGFIPTSLLDWDGKIVSVLYFSGCNFRCPFCHNADLVLHPEDMESVCWDKVLDYLKKNKDFLDGVCITGGEPLLQNDMAEIMGVVKKMGLLVKLDTNGSFPDRLEELIDKGMVDFVSMDIKAPLGESYSGPAGAHIDMENLKKSIQILISSNIEYEFRTTVLPRFHDKNAIARIAKDIKGAKKYALQQFVPRNTLDPAFMDEAHFSWEDMEGLAETARSALENVIIRGKRE